MINTNKVGRRMSGIKVSVKTKAKETLKLSNHLRSYLFEQEYNYSIHHTPVQKDMTLGG